jgi:hypothetical protein
VTFLLTDIVGSTRLWEAHAEAMRLAVPGHYAVLAEAVSSHGGVRPVEQGEGDSIVAVFSRATDAVAAALCAQRRLAEQEWPEGIELRVRIALHTGQNRTARDLENVNQRPADQAAATNRVRKQQPRQDAAGICLLPLSAHRRSGRTRGFRPAPEICGSPDRSGKCRLRVPCIHENALLLVDGLDNRRAEDAAGLAGGELRDQLGRASETCNGCPAGMVADPAH